jgi:hypothetical protein
VEQVVQVHTFTTLTITQIVQPIKRFRLEPIFIHIHQVQR